MMRKKLNNSNILDRVLGTNKRRDLLVLQQLAQGFTHKEVSQQVRLSRSRVSQIAEANRELLDELTLKTEFATKMGRIRLANRELRRKEKEKSKKDKLDWLEYIRREQEGEDRKPSFIIIECGIPRPPGLPPLNPEAEVIEKSGQLENKSK